MADRRGWPEAVRQRCFVVWSGIGNRNASRTRSLYRQDVPDDARIPGASTIRRWSVEEGWKDWAGEKEPPLFGTDPHQWQTMWLRHVLRQADAAFRAQQEMLLGTAGGDPLAALARADASMQRLFARPGVLALFRASFSDADAPTRSLPERERRVRKHLLRRKKQREPG